MLNKNYLIKAERRLETAKFALEKGYICSAVSNCYYALFNLMQAVVGEAEKKRWEHGGLPKKFVKEVYTKGILSGEELKGFIQFVRRLYFMRRLADYYDTVLSNSVDAMKEIEIYVLKVEELLKKLLEMDYGVD
jgi:uncharacterized protein (UPF0332 family)